MPFFSGRATFCRFKVSGKPPRTFGPDELNELSQNAIGKQTTASGDGSQVGWIAGDHILDTRFDLAKNVINDALHFGLRIDTLAIPADLLRAYTVVELEALAAQNPSGHPSNRQKREARLMAKERLEEEAKDGRFLRRKWTPILWDALSNELLVGTTAASALDRLSQIFHHTFNRKIEPLTAGRQAFLLAELSGQDRAVDDAKPTAFVASQGKEISWVPDESNRDFLGNEFLLWLWFFLENDDDTIKLSDDSEVAIMISKSLTLECPRGQYGKQSFSSDGPARLPESMRAIQAGRLPRKAGLILVRHDQQYELTIQAENLAVSGVRLPTPEGETDRVRYEERVQQIRNFIETMDLLYQSFLTRRLGNGWTGDLAKMKKWLHRDQAMAG